MCVLNISHNIVVVISKLPPPVSFIYQKIINPVKPAVAALHTVCTGTCSPMDYEPGCGYMLLHRLL